MTKIQLIKNFINQEIKLGYIKRGERLPSCRSIAIKFSINKITVNKAYRELEQEHIVFCIPRGGFYVIDSDYINKREEKYVDFYTVKPDEKMVPYKEFEHAIHKAVDFYKPEILCYNTSSGLRSLQLTVKSIFENDGIYTNEDCIVITSGAQQGISLIFQTLFHNKDKKLLIERPTYNLALDLAKYFDITVIDIKREEAGFDFETLENKFKQGDIHAFYIMSHHHNPTGYSLSEKDKKRIAALANTYDVIIIEDDYLAGLGTKSGALPIHYYDTNNHTVYIRSFSKSFMPGCRLGATVLPQKLVNQFVNAKKLMDLNTSTLSQAALEIFIKSGMYERQIRKVKKSYSAKLRKAKDILESFHLNDMMWHVPNEGFFIWINITKKINTSEIEQFLFNKGIIIKFTDEYFLNMNKDNNLYLRLCISGVSLDNISTLSIVLKTIQTHMEKN